MERHVGVVGVVGTIVVHPAPVGCRERGRDGKHAGLRGHQGAIEYFWLDALLSSGGGHDASFPRAPVPFVTLTGS